MWRRISELQETDPAEAQRTKTTHYVSVLIAIANGTADPDPESLARAVLRQIADSAPGPSTNPRQEAS
jgi:hypothetical protein